MAAFWGRDDRCCTGRCCRASCVIISGLAALALGILLVFGTPPFVAKEIKKTLEVYNGSASYDKWVEPTEPVFMTYFVFNITNSDDVLNGERPNVEQFGPFTYLELRPRKNITFINNGTVKWIQPKSYIQFVNQSIAADDQFEVCTINFPIMFLASMIDPLLDKIHILPKWVVDDVLEVPKILDALAGEDTLICKTVKEVIWGLQDPVIDRLQLFLQGSADKLRALIPQLVKQDWKEAAAFLAEKFSSIAGLFPPGGVVSLQVNGSDDGEWATFTGTKDMQLINTLDLYNNSKLVPWWLTKTCNMVNGTDGTQYHPDIKKDDMLFTFVTELCRSIYLIYNGSLELKGIELYRFTPPPALFDNGTVFPFLHGFCNPRCWPSGTQDISLCKGGVPLMMSSPHFLYADPVYLENVTGMHPNFNDHATTVDLEPNTGLMLQGNKRLQLNVRVSNITILPGSYALRECFLPLFYANESAIVSDKDAATIRNSLLLPKIATIAQWCLIAIGTIVLAITVPYNIRRYVKENERDYIPLQPIPEPRGKSETDPLIN